MNLRQVTDGAHVSLHNEGISQTVFASNIYYKIDKITGTSRFQGKATLVGVVAGTEISNFT